MLCFVFVFSLWILAPGRMVIKAKLAQSSPGTLGRCRCVGRTLGVDSPMCRKGIQGQGEGKWAGQAPAQPDVKQEVNLPLPIVTWAGAMLTRGRVVIINLDCRFDGLWNHHGNEFLVCL